MKKMSQLAFILFFLLGVCACSFVNRGYGWNDRTHRRPNLYIPYSRYNRNRFYSYLNKTDQQNHYSLNRNSFQLPISPNPKYPTNRISTRLPGVEDYVLEKNENTSNESKTIQDESEYIERPEDFRNNERASNSETAISLIAKQRSNMNQSENKTYTHEEPRLVSIPQKYGNNTFLTDDSIFNSTEFTSTISTFPSKITISSTEVTTSDFTKKESTTNSSKISSPIITETSSSLSTNGLTSGKTMSISTDGSSTLTENDKSISDDSTQNTSTTTNEVSSSDVLEINTSSNMSSTIDESSTLLQNTTINDKASTDTSESSIFSNITATGTSETSKENTETITSSESTTSSHENTSETTNAKTASTASEELTSNTTTGSSATDISPETSSITNQEVTSKPTISIVTSEESSPISATISTKKIETSTDEVTSTSTDEVTSTSTDEVTSTSPEIKPTEHLKIIDNSKIRTVKVALSVVFISITFFGTVAVGIYFLKRRRQRIPYEQLTLEP